MFVNDNIFFGEFFVVDEFFGKVVIIYSGGVGVDSIRDDVMV